MPQKYFTFIWRIDNFSYYWQKASRVEIVSPEFDVNHATGTTKWKLVFNDRTFPDTTLIERNKKTVRLSLHRIDCHEPESIALNIQMSLVKNDKSPFLMRYKEETEVIFLNNFFVYYLLESVSEIFLKNNELIPQDVLIVRCKMWESENTLNLQKGQCFAHTLLALERLSFVAVVDEFSDLIPELKRTVSIKSTSVEQLMFSTYICLSDEGKIDICIPVEADYIHLCFCKILVLHNSGNWVNCGQNSEWRKNGEVCEITLTQDFKTLMDKQNYLQNGAVTFKCDVAYSTEEEPQIIQTIKYGLDSSEIPQHRPFCATPSSLIEDLISLYKEGTLCDTVLRTEIESFPAHKAVLSARSPVFKKMFTIDMREKMKNSVDIPDLNADTIRNLLNFMYTDTIDGMDWQTANDLYFAADKYEIESLKLKCTTFLKLNIRPSNCCDVLLLSDMHQDTDLKRFVEEYIVTRDKDVFGTEEWRTFMESHVQLAADTMCLKYSYNSA